MHGPVTTTSLHLSQLFVRPIIVYTTFYFNLPNSTVESLQLDDTRDSQHLAERFLAREDCTINHSLWCKNTHAVTLCIAWEECGKRMCAHSQNSLVVGMGICKSEAGERGSMATQCTSPT